MIKELNHLKLSNLKMASRTLIPPYIWSNYEIPLPIPEYKFIPNRQWRIDFAWPLYRLAIEIEGGVFTNGRHIRPEGFIADIEKYNMLTEKGWILLRYIPKSIDYKQIKRVIDNRKKEFE